MPFLKLYPEASLTEPEDFEETYDCVLTEGEVDREKLLDCYIRKMSILKGFKPVRQSEIEQPVQNKEPQADARLGKRESQSISEDSGAICQLQERKKVLNEAALILPVYSGVFLKDDMYEHLCKCDDCTELYNVSDPCSGLLTDKIYQDANYEEAVAETDALPEQEEEKKDENADQEFMDYMAKKFKERTGRDITALEQMVMSEHYGKLKQRLGDIILSSGKTEITEEDMRNFLGHLKTD